MIKYRKGRVNLSATVFVPYDCHNNCSFCVSKKDYADTSNFSLKAITKMIEKLNKNDLIQEYVITGGEPLADINGLKAIVDSMEKTVYINTTLPKNNIDKAIEYINIEDKIKGINISRHTNFVFPSIGGLKNIEEIKKSIRINSVIPDNVDFKSLMAFIMHYGKKRRDINLRADFRKVTPETLKCRDNISDFLAEYFDYVCTESCLVCNSEHFSVDDRFIVSYHRGLEHSSVLIGDKCYVNDILIKQDGNIYKDWDCIKDDNFKEWILQ